MTWIVFLSLLAKSSLIAGASLVAAPLLAQRPADRVDILRGAVCLLLAMPVISALLPALELSLLPALAQPAETPLPLWSGEVGPVAGVAVSGSLPWPTPALAVAAVWVVGVLIVAGRLALGLLTLQRWSRTGRPITCAAWRAPIDRLSPRKRPLLVSSPRVSGPLSWGADPGVILIDDASLAEREAAPAILAHEMAHLRRRDWLFLILSRLALALFWFNPLVWRLHGELAARSEEAADADALNTVDRRLYARALVRLAAHPAPCAATAMAADARTLKKRIACIMTDVSPRRRPLTVGLTIAALAIAATPLAALELTRQSWSLPGTPPAPPAPPALSVTEIAPPPAPPAPPAPPEAPRGPLVITRYNDGTGRVVSREATPEERAMADEDRTLADDARRAADQARIHADAARVEASRARAEAAVRRGEAAQDRLAAEDARKQAEQARMLGERARQTAEREMARARIEMGRGAIQMRRGADDMRREAVRLRDPAYRAKVIADNAARGNTVTDRELRDLSASLPAQADDMDRNADRMEADSRRS